MSYPPSSIDPYERIFTLEDVHALILSMKKQLLRAAIVGLVLGALYALLKPVCYTVEASFKEAISKSGQEHAMKNFLMGFSPSADSQSIYLMKSNLVLKTLIEKHGMQAQVIQGTLPFRMYRRIWENFRTNLGSPLNDVDWFSFSNVHYSGEDTLSFRIRFSDPTHYAIADESGRELGVGKLGEEVHIQGVRFTLNKTPSRLYLKKNYPLKILSWISAVKGFRKNLTITASKKNIGIYDLSYSHRDRHKAVDLLNDLMGEYRTYLKKDHDQVASEQITYLEKKQSQIFQNMENLIDSYADQLAEEIQENGFCGIDQQVKNQLGPHDELRSRLFAIEVELPSLDNVMKPELLSKSNTIRSSFADIFDKIPKLQADRDLLELSLRTATAPNSWEIHTEEKVQVRSQKELLKKTLQEVQRAEKWSLPSEFSWAERFRSPEQRQDLTHYLTNQLRLLAVQEKILEDRMFPSDVHSELEGIDLNTARHMLFEYNTKLDVCEQSMRRYEHLREEIDLPDFEISSLSPVLEDKTSQGLIQEAALILSKIKDERYRSEKETGRWTEEIALQKKILSDHLQQLWKIEKLSADLIREKITKLQQISLDSINRQISIWNQQIQEAISGRKEALQIEKNLLEQKMEEIRSRAMGIPDRWKLDYWLKLKSELSAKVISVMTELTESKTISHHLHQVESKPVDLAVLPIYAQESRFFLSAILWSFLCVIGLFLKKFFQTLFHGFPTSVSKLKAIRFPFSGTLSSFCDGINPELPTGSDLETLRQLGLFASGTPQQKIVLLVGGKGPDYSFAFAQNLARAGQKSLLIRCDFSPKFAPSERPGLLQWLQGQVEEISIKKGEGFDFISSGGFTPFSTEILQSKKLEEFISQSKQKYDFILLWLRSPIDVAAVQVLLNHAEKTIVTVSGETTELLTPFMNWAYHKENRPLTFISSQ